MLDLGQVHVLVLHVRGDHRDDAGRRRLHPPGLRRHQREQGTNHREDIPSGNAVTINYYDTYILCQSNHRTLYPNGAQSAVSFILLSISWIFNLVGGALMIVYGVEESQVRAHYMKLILLVVTQRRMQDVRKVSL